LKKKQEKFFYNPKKKSKTIFSRANVVEKMCGLFPKTAKYGCIFRFPSAV